jgi:transcription antitermination factor NusG
MTSPKDWIAQHATVLDLGSWCILRTGSADTLRALKSLSEAGVTVWTPTEKRFGKMPRTQAPFDKTTALMPSYLFARAEHVTELLRLAMAPGGEHPRFSVFRYGEGIPLIADAELNPLREEEDRKGRVFDRWRRRGRKGPKLQPGTHVRMPEGPFAGIGGIVQDVQGQFTLVNIDVFGKQHSLKVASLLLAGNVAEDAVPSRFAA